MANRISNLLTAEEKMAIYSPPILNDTEITEYFTLNEKELAVLKKFKDIDRAIYFAISLVFLKIKKSLVNFSYQDVTKERQHVMQRYFPNKSSPRTQLQDPDVIVRIENKVLALYGYRRYSESTKKDLLNKLQKLAAKFPRQRKLCQEFLKLLNSNKVAIPGYTSLQETISEVWNNENKRVTKSYYRHTSSYQRITTLSLLEKTDKLHRIVSIKQDMKSFNNTDLLAEIEKHDQLKPIFKIAEIVIPKLQLPATTIRYYADMINYYNGSRLKKIDQNTLQIYLLCYSFTRYQMLNDNLLEALKKRTNDYNSKATTYAKEQMAKQLANSKKHRVQASKMLTAIHDYKKQLIPKTEIFKYIPEADMLMVAKLLVDDNLDEDFLFWKYIDDIKDAIKLNLRKIFLTIDFVVNDNSILQDAIEYIKETLLNSKDLRETPLPSNIIRWVGKDKTYVINDESIPIFKRLEFLLYKKIIHHITTNKITLKHSIRHKAIEDDLYSKVMWKKKKNTILKSIGYPKLKTPIKKHLKNEYKDLDELYKIVNNDIINGKNQGVKIITEADGNKSWRLRPLESATDPNESLFAEFQKRSVVDIISFADSKTKFSKAFESILPRSKKGGQDFALIMAVILANAIRVGAGKMADISDLKKTALITAESAYVRSETLTAAIDTLNNAAAEFPIFKDWYIGGVLHGSLDGVKLEVALRNIKARHSSKYFGTDLGVSAYHAILNCFPIASMIIGSNEYEGNFTFEMVEHQNTSELQLQNISTDKHGTNSLNYGLFDLTDRLFAPRIPKPHNETLWGFNNLKNYDGYIVKPKKIVNEKSITTPWDDVQRLVASLISGEANPSDTIRKLSSSNYTSNTKKALTQYNNIVRSKFILMYIDSEEFRRTIMRALNRGEAYNNLYQAITLLKKGEFRGKSEAEIEVWNQCTRLISAIILYYNTYILNSLYFKSTNEQTKKYLLSLSPGAWVHINMLGYYQFCGGDGLVCT